MTILSHIILPAAAGLFLGIIYFGGLWLTLKRLPSSRQPAIMVLGSYACRLAICLAGFILVARIGELQGILICAAGFIASRMILVRHWGKREPALPGPGGIC